MVRVQRVRSRRVLVAMVVDLAGPVVGLSVSLCRLLGLLKLAKLVLLVAGDLLRLGMVLGRRRRRVMSQDRRVRADLYPG